MSALPTPLVSAAWLREHLADVVILDARASAGARAAYLAGHVAGARYLDLETDLSAPADAAHGGRHPLPSLDAWCRTLGRVGVSPGVAVVVYDGAGGMLAAARAWWMLRAVGHERVAVLDGGLTAAEAEGVAMGAGEESARDVGSYPATQWSSRTVDADEVDARRTDVGWRVVDVRAAERFEGRVEPLDPIAGHIAGAINLPCTANLSDGRFLDAATLRARFDAAHLAPERTIVSCGSGVTACHTLLAMAHAGLDGAALYVGSWSEWCRSDRPREPR
ncbi:MAG: sulfurtransferase [Sandaracinus sp.]|nr:sulfurtransferase [Sandaracinus sp.]MCB9615563.1 sulfurtransferase [Sandaracinus sp.]MCB9624125.1 sulfurtransferase [Sandaracinus sp.]